MKEVDWKKTFITMAQNIWLLCLIMLSQGRLYSAIVTDSTSTLTYSHRFCENDGPQSIQCNAEMFINITHAMYGRLSSSYCGSGHSVTNCKAARSMEIVARLCHGMTLCRVEAANKVFGDPCVGTLKYLEISYSCLEGSRFPSIQRSPDAYVYSDQFPMSPIVHLQPNSTELKELPLRFRIYNTTKINYNPQKLESIYSSAVDFLSTQLKVKAPSNSVCYPQIGNFGSEFCAFPEYGYIFTYNTFIPAIYVGDSYDVDIVVRDYSPIPFIGMTSIRISAVPSCFPMKQLYDKMRALCPSDIFIFTFPSSLVWLNTHRKKMPISISPPVTVSRVYINTNLLVNFKRDTSYWVYEISFTVSGTTFKRNFTYVPSTLDFKEGQIIQTRGTEFNITIEPPLEIAAGESKIDISLKLLNYNGGTEIEFNNQNAIVLYGTPRISKCPGSSCMNAYKAWKNAVDKLKYSKNFQCISDEDLQEIHLNPCNSDYCQRSINVSLAAKANSIIYHFQEEGTFKRFTPTFYRVIFYEYDGQSFPGYSEKYFCAPKPYDGIRRFICLNRYRGRLRIRQQSAPDFQYLYNGSIFRIDVQAEATVGGIFMYDRCVINIRLYAPSPLTTLAPTPIESSTLPILPSSQLLTSTEIIIPSTPVTSQGTEISLFTVLLNSTLISPASHVGTPHTLSPTMTTSTVPSEATYNESLAIIVPMHPSLVVPLNITCIRSTSAASIIGWSKDGVQLQQTGPSLIFNTPTTHDQGYYQCFTKLSGITFLSDAKLVTFIDVFTSSVYLTVMNRQFTPDLTDESSAGFKSLSEEIIRATANAIRTLPTTRTHVVKVEKFSKGSVVSQVKISSPVSTTHSLTSFYDTLTKLLVTSADENTFGAFQIPVTTIIVVNKEKCLSQTSNTGSSKGPYLWPVTQSGNIATAPCPNGPSNVNATRECLGDFSRGAFWGSISDGGCNFNNKRTTELKSLSETTINSTNAESVASNLEDLTSNVTVLTVDDTLLASNTFQKLATINVTSDKIVNDLLGIASNLLQTNESVLAASQTQGKALNNIVKGVEEIADKIQLPNKTGQAVVKVSSGVAIQAMKLGASSNSNFNFALKTSSFSPDDVVSNEAFDSNRVEIGLELPATLLNDLSTASEKRLSFVVYGSSQFFQATKQNALGQRVTDLSSKSNSKVISAHVAGIGKVSLSNPLLGTFKKILSSSNDRCVFWNFTMNDGYGAWSSEGCRRVETNSERTICECDHMTNFAIVFDPYAGTVKAESETHEKILGIISFIGIGLSLGGLFLTILTLLLFRRLRRTLPPKILIHLCFSLMLTLISFVAGADRTESLYVCRGFAIAIHYFMLTTFLWMTVEAVNLYISFVVVMGSYITRFILKAAIYAWGLPVIIVAVTASLRFSDYGNDRYCIISNWAAYGSLFIPICLILAVNFFVLIKVFLALRSSAKGKKVTKDQRRTGISQLRIAVTFSCILGLTWIFGIFAVGDGRLPFQYLFCIFNSLQGFTIFLLHVARHNDARNHWLFFLTGRGLNYHRASMTSTSHKTYQTNKRFSNENFRMRTPSSEQNGTGTLTSTLGKTSVSSISECGTSFA